MSFNVKEATFLVQWTAETSAIYQTEEQQGLFRQARSVNQLGPLEPALKISKYVLEVLENYDSTLLEEGETKEVIDLAIMVGNLETELNNSLDVGTKSPSRFIHEDEVQNLYKNIQEKFESAIQRDSAWAEGLELLKKGMESYSEVLTFPLIKAAKDEWDTSSDEGEIPPPPPQAPAFSSDDWDISLSVDIGITDNDTNSSPSITPIRGSPVKPITSIQSNITG